MKPLADCGLDLLRTFHRTAERGSMTEAAKSLFITQPAVSHAVSLLEERLGEKLFDRAGRRLVLTAAGRAVFETTSAMAEALRAGDRELARLRGIEESTLTIGAPYLLLHDLLAPFLSRFHKDHPAVHIHVEIENRMDEMQALAKSGAVDLFFLAAPGLEYADSALRAEPVSGFRYCFMASRAHFGALEGRKLTLAEVNRRPIAILRPGNNTRTFFDERLREEGLELNVHYEAATMAVVQDFARMGLGVAAVMRLPGFKDEELFELKLERRFKPGVIIAASRKDEPLSPAAEAFLSLVREEAPVFPEA